MYTESAPEACLGNVSPLYTKYVLKCEETTQLKLSSPHSLLLLNPIGEELKVSEVTYRGCRGEGERDLQKLVMV